jgi:hypothetical protein
MQVSVDTLQQALYFRIATDAIPRHQAPSGRDLARNGTASVPQIRGRVARYHSRLTGLSSPAQIAETRLLEPNLALVLASGERVSNPRPQAWEACALPTELPPRCPDSRASRPSKIPAERRRNVPDARRPMPTHRRVTSRAAPFAVVCAQLLPHMHRAGHVRAGDDLALDRAGSVRGDRRDPHERRHHRQPGCEPTDPSRSMRFWPA